MSLDTADARELPEGGRPFQIADSDERASHERMLILAYALGSDQAFRADLDQHADALGLSDLVRELQLHSDVLVRDRAGWAQGAGRRVLPHWSERDWQDFLLAARPPAELAVASLAAVQRLASMADRRRVMLDAVERELLANDDRRLALLRLKQWIEKVGEDEDSPQAVDLAIQGPLELSALGVNPDRPKQTALLSGSVDRGLLRETMLPKQPAVGPLGFPLGGLTALRSKTGAGADLVALQLAADMHTQQNVPVIWFGGRRNPRQWLQRWILNRAATLARGEGNPEAHFEAAKEQVGFQGDRLAWFPVSPLDSALKAIHHVADRHGPPLVVIDTLEACVALTSEADDVSAGALASLLQVLSLHSSETAGILLISELTSNNRPPAWEPLLKAAVDWLYTIRPQASSQKQPWAKVTARSLVSQTPESVRVRLLMNAVHHVVIKADAVPARTAAQGEAHGS